jgi:hypothetical protein
LLKTSKIELRTVGERRIRQPANEHQISLRALPSP